MGVAGQAVLSSTGDAHCVAQDGTAHGFSPFCCRLSALSAAAVFGAGTWCKGPGPQDPSQAGAGAATPFLLHGAGLGCSCSVHYPPIPLQGGCRGVSAKPPCHSAELHAQGAVSTQGCSQVWDASAWGPGAVPASLWWQQVSPGVTALGRVGRRNIISSQKLFGHRVPMPPQSLISWGAQGEVTSGSHTRWDADLWVQCRFWLLCVGTFHFVTLKKWQSRATSSCALF